MRFYRLLAFLVQLFLFLSILFMRFRLEALSSASFKPASFNSLYEIQAARPGQPINVLSFNSLYEILIFNWVLYGAADFSSFNSLYEIPLAPLTKLEFDFHFQFSLWDSGSSISSGSITSSSFNSLYEIHKKGGVCYEWSKNCLSILFMRFRGEFLFFRFK